MTVKGIEVAGIIYDNEDETARTTATEASQTATTASQTASTASQTATQASQTATEASQKVDEMYEAFPSDASASNKLVSKSDISVYYHKCIYARTNQSGSELVKTFALEDGKCYTIEGYQGDNYKRTRVYMFSGVLRVIDEITPQANPFTLNQDGNVLTVTFANWPYNQCRIYEESPANGTSIG